METHLQHQSLEGHLKPIISKQTQLETVEVATISWPGSQRETLQLKPWALERLFRGANTGFFQMVATGQKDYCRGGNSGEKVHFTNLLCDETQR